MAQAGTIDRESQQARLIEMFSVQSQAGNAGLDTDRDYSEAINALREAGTVQKGSPRSLLGLPEIDGSITVERENWTLLGFEACERGFRENTVFSSEIMAESASLKVIGPTIIQMIGKEHKRNRAVAQPLFLRPRTLDWWKPNWIDEAVESLLKPLEGRSRADLNLELCAWLPMWVVSRSLGLAGTDELDFRFHLTRSSFGARNHTSEEVAESRRVVDAILTDMVASRRRQPQDDVISGLLENELKLPDGTSRKMTQEELFSFAKLVIFAGGGTTWRQLGITIDALLTHRDAWDQCLADRSLIEAAVDETLRWRATSGNFHRVATCDIEVDGVTIPQGARVNLWLASGNRDPRVFDNPDAFDMHRPKHHHLGFGLGPHRCLGMDVAKQEMIAAINGLMDRWPNLRYDPEAPRPIFAGLDMRGMTGLPVLLD
ncbi:cytochrome P450 [Novosphingobium sp. TH158]|uniref:cytochrome P450 n=1 Tax=Novosphingobium sp. TH158 TaxID=2067455 RepID=UPI000C7D49CE|nr:cytochrome P450 [Novosphingobium sp. TH158]PLK26963.1 cytochrome P450 [Novosphingobium sp. TH158]